MLYTGLKTEKMAKLGGKSKDMGKRTYGECKPWEINSKKFQKPNTETANQIKVINLNE